MKIPGKKIGGWAQEIAKECEASRQQRITQGVAARAYFLRGTADNNPAAYNKTFAHVQRLGAYMFSPADVRFNIGFDATIGDPWLTRAEAAGRYLSREYHRSDVDIAFGEGLTWALVKGSTFIKHLWGHNGIEPYIVQPEFMGVLTEDRLGLDRQDAFLETIYLTPSQFSRMVQGRPDAAELMRKVKNAASTDEGEQEKTDDLFRQIIVGGTNPVGTTPTGAKGNVQVVASPGAYLAPEVQRNLIRLQELWVIDDQREDYTTIQFVDENIVIEGDIRHRNLTGIKGHHPYTQICPNPLAGYFWGRSELSDLQMLQDLLNRRVEDVKRIMDLQAMPPKAFIGFTGMTPEKYRALIGRGGYISEQSPSAKVEDLAPKMPDAIFQDINELSGFFDDLAGFKPILMGQGEPGVRAGVHAQTLVRNASPALRNKALLIERQCESSADFCFRLLQNKDARVFVSDKKENFLLDDMPEDFRISVDSHSGSPVFADDAKQEAAFLEKTGAIGPEEVIMLTNPPMKDNLIARLREREKQKAEFLAQHPELLEKKKR